MLGSSWPLCYPGRRRYASSGDNSRVIRKSWTIHYHILWYRQFIWFDVVFCVCTGNSILIFQTTSEWNGVQERTKRHSDVCRQKWNNSSKSTQFSDDEPDRFWMSCLRCIPPDGFESRWAVNRNKFMSFTWVFTIFVNNIYSHEHFHVKAFRLTEIRNSSTHWTRLWIKRSSDHNRIAKCRPQER